MERSKIDVWRSFKFSNETDFEKILLQSSLFDNLDVYDAKISLNRDGGYNRYPDIVLFEKDLSYWSIGEVEIAEHSFESHVFPQIVELYTLIELNLEFIQSQFLNHPNVAESKDLRDLVSYNKPFLTLISDRFPTKHINSISLLKNFCNVSIISRFKDMNENYIYSYENNMVNEIGSTFSSCLTDGILLFIERPNILLMHKMAHTMVHYEGEQITITSRNEIIHGKKRLFWIMDKSFNKGKYKMQLVDNKLILKR